VKIHLFLTGRHFSIVLMFVWIVGFPAGIGAFGPTFISAPFAPGVRLGTSQNWSGYAATGPAGSVSDVKGSWIVPAVVGTCPSKSQYASFWVGIDGYSSKTVEQIGTDSDCRNGSPSYYAWYEFYPKGSITISGDIKPGDKISAEVKYAAGKFTVSITDMTISKTFSKTASVTSANRSSAEWIAEAPSSLIGILPLADFGTVYLGSDNTGNSATCYATVNGVTGPIGSFGASVQPITMTTHLGVVKAQPSALSVDGTSFSVQWKSAGP